MFDTRHFDFLLDDFYFGGEGSKLEDAQEGYGLQKKAVLYDICFMNLHQKGFILLLFGLPEFDLTSPSS